MPKEKLPVEVLQQFHYEPVCVKTGVDRFDKWVKQTFTYVPPWVYLLLVLGLLPLLIVYLIVRKQADVYFPAVKGLKMKRNLLTLAVVICLLTGLGFLIAAIEHVKWGIVGVLLLALSIALGFMGMNRVWIRGTLSSDGTTLTLIGAHPEFVRRVQGAEPPAAAESSAGNE